MNLDKLRAVTTKEISGDCIDTIPIGTEFEVLYSGEEKGAGSSTYSSCMGLGVTLIWDDEFELISN